MPTSSSNSNEIQEDGAPNHSTAPQKQARGRWLDDNVEMFKVEPVFE